MPVEDEPTPWELHRSYERILVALDRIDTRMLTLDVFNVYQANADRRSELIEKNQADDRALSNAAHVALDTRIDDVEAGILLKLETQATRAEVIGTESRASKTRTWLAIGLVVLAALLSFAAALILRGTGAA